LTHASFNRAMDAVRGLKIAGAVKKASALSRLRGPQVKRVWLELAVDGGGYCAVKVFKHQDDIAPAAELRFVGSNVKGWFFRRLILALL